MGHIYTKKLLFNFIDRSTLTGSPVLLCAKYDRPISWETWFSFFLGHGFSFSASSTQWFEEA